MARQGTEPPELAAGVTPGRFSALLRELAPDATLDDEAAAAPPPAPGATIGRFELVRVLGRGGFGVVWEARDPELKRAVALKLVRPGRSAGAEERLLREAEVVARLSHPNIVALHDVGRTEGGPYLVLELLEGESLARRLGRGRLPIVEAVGIATEVARGLAHAHAHGVVHRDLKPANVFLCADGQVKLLDLGMAHAFGHRKLDGGTPAYMAPEQRAGAPEDERTDVFALGVLFFELLAGRPPFEPSEAPSGPARASALEVPGAPELAALVRRMLAHDPLERPRSAAAVLPELSASLVRLAGGASQAALATVAGPTRRWPAAAAAFLLAAALLAGAGLLATRGGSAPADPPSVAVLPFADLSEGGNQAWLADGIAEEILDELSGIEGLRVTGRTSSFRFRDRDGDLSALGERLRVANVLEGSVRRVGSRVRVSAELVKVDDGYRRWSQSFDRDVGDLFAVQDEIAQAVAGALRATLLAGGRAGAAAPASGAHEELLRGRHLARRGTEADQLAAIQALERAVALDPRYAPAQAALAQARVALLAYQSSDRPGWEAALAETRASALASAERAIALAPDLASGYLARSQVQAAVGGAWAASWADLQLALARSPRDLDVRFQHARALAQSGRLEAAVTAMEGVLRDDPLSASAAVSLGAMYAAVGRYGDSRAALERALAIEPKHAKAVRNLCATELLDRRPGRALELASGIGPTWARRHIEALAYHDLGRAQEAHEALDWLTGTRWNQFQVAELYAWFGDRDAAFAWLERALAARDMGLFHLKVDPFLAGLRDDPRYPGLVARIGLPPD